MTSHLEDYLNYYKTCTSPGYAVLVTGEWGSGKTFQVKKALKEDERFYVSLFGLQTTEDVHSAVLAAMDPTMANAKKFIDDLGSTAKDMGGLYALGGIFPKVLSAMVRYEIDTNRVLVFDDLERCGLNLQDTLGAINAYVEHHGCRVVVIAHEEELLDGFRHKKEKIFGQTIKVVPQSKEAFDGFLKELTTRKNNKFLQTHSLDVLQTFDLSGVKSLRVLKHLIEDLARLHNTLEVEHLRNEEVMSDVIRFFSALNIEVRSGNLSEHDLSDRINKTVSYEMKKRRNDSDSLDIPPIVAADEKYSLTELNSDLFRDDVLIEMLIKGRYNQTQICDSLNNHHSFLATKDAPPWKLVMKFGELEDNVVLPALNRLQEQFDEREVTDSGEMLHIFCLRHMLAENEILKGDARQIAKENTQYIDDLLASDRLPPRSTDWRWNDSFIRAHDGYMYWVMDSYKGKHKATLQYLIEAREKALENRFPEITKELLGLVANDARAFLEQVCSTNNGDNPYAFIPVLAHIPADVFVKAWLNSPKENWRILQYALQGRYAGRKLVDELNDEQEWIRSVVSIIDDEVNKADGFQALRLRRLIPEDLRKHWTE